MTRTWKVLALPLLLGALADPLAAQQQPTPQSGTIVGRVVDRNTGQPVPEANVAIVGSTRGGRTGEDGRYRIAGVSVGTHPVRVTRLGYTAETRPANVTAGAEETVNFQIGQTAVQIDEVVVTATGETQRRRETGNAVTVVQPSQERLATTTTIAQVLAASAPGVYVNSPGGTTGSANRIRIRGANSVSLTNEPLLIIDGIRVANDITNTTVLSGAGGIGVGGQASSRFNDINPDDIESMEIIKGPAAAALYGTAAANGVIQVRTKRGRAGRTRWTVYGEAGTQEDRFTYPANFAWAGTTSAGNATTACTLDTQTRRTCTPSAAGVVSWNPLEEVDPYTRGYRSSLGLNASGGTDVVTYFLSGDIDQDQGVFEPNKLRRTSLRANLTSQLRSNLTTQVFTNYMASRLKFPQNDNNILGILGSGLLGFAFDDERSRGYLAGQPPQEIFKGINTQENVERFVGSALATWQALPWLSASGQAGVDFLDRRNRETIPANTVIFNASTMDGSRQANSYQIWNYTANGSLTGNANILPDLRSSTTAGVQFTQEMVQGTRAFGAKLLAGTGSLQGTSARFAVAEQNTDNRTVGGLIQQQLAWRDRLFVTGAMRTDNNSAFGSNFGWIIYPAASISWVVSEEAFFPRSDIVSSLRLRTAYGESGQRPNFRDAITFFNTQTVTTVAGDVPGILVGGTGNADLEPERSREFELGFELGLLRDRLSVDFTSYNKRTTNLLIARPLPPSLGLTTSQFDNLGVSSNRGIEVQLTGRVFERDPVRFDVTIGASTNRNRLEDIGDLPNGDPIPAIIFGIQRHEQGFPLGGYWDEKYTWADKNGDGIITRVNCPGQTQIAGGPECEVEREALPSYLGNPLPTREFSFNPRLTLFRNIEIAVLVDYKAGFKQFNNTGRFRCNFSNCEEAYNQNTPLELQARNIAHLLGTDAGYVEDSDFTKLREVSLSLLAPRTWSNVARVGDVRLTLAGRNLKTWTDYTGFDPEVNSTPTALFSTSDFLTQPPLRIFSARLNVSF